MKNKLLKEDYNKHNNKVNKINKPVDF